MPLLTTIPTVDISAFIAQPESFKARAIVDEVRAACTSVGFLQITGHGVPRDLQEKVLKGAVAFFALPIEEKRKVDRAMPGSCGKGFEVMRTQEQQRGLGGDFKEGFYISADVPASDPLAKAHPHLVGPNRWPAPDVLPYAVFKDPVDRYMVEMNRVIRVMFQIIAAGLPYGAHIFDEFQASVPLAILSPKHYPPVTEDGLGAGPHSDFGALTLLLQDEHSGLQVQYEGQWIDVAPNPAAYVVNIGDMLQRWTRGEYKSTIHRVLASKGSTHRYSLPFFFDGNLDCRLAPFDDHQNGEKAVTVEEHMLERFMSTFLKEKGRS